MFKEKNKFMERQCVICGTKMDIGTYHGKMPGMMWNMCSRHSRMASLKESRNPYYAKRNEITLVEMMKDEEKYLFRVAYERSIIVGTKEEFKALEKRTKKE